MWGVQGWPMWTLGWSVCSEPAAKRQPSTDENPYNWPKPAHMAWSSSTLHCQWEWRIQMEKVKQRKAADLTEDAAPYWSLWKDVVWVEQILSNGWKWSSSPHLNKVFFFFFTQSQSAPKQTLKTLPSTSSSGTCWYFYTYSVLHSFSAQCRLSILIHALLHLLTVTIGACVCVCLCARCTTARGPAISQPHFWGWQWDRTSWGP